MEGCVVMEMLVKNLIDLLVDKYKYRKLPEELSKRVKDLYRKALPFDYTLGENFLKIKDKSGRIISNGYSRIVIGDYGAFIEIPKDKMVLQNVYIPREQVYRTTPRYINSVKYLWYTSYGDNNVKIYQQLRGVSYADYKPNMWYISPYEVTLELL